MKTTMYKRIVVGLLTSGVATLAFADQGYESTHSRRAVVPQDQSAAPAPAQQAAPNEGTMQTPMLKSLTAQQFVNDAAIGGMKEIRLSQIALDKSQNPDVKNFASRMVVDHTAANNKLAAIAQQEGLTFPSTNTFAADDPMWNNPMVVNPPTLKGEGAYLLTTNAPDLSDYQAFQHLKGLSGREFDLAYAKEMVSDHINTVNEFEAASRNLTDPSLRQFATDTLPTLREHSQMAQKLDNQLAGQTAGTVRSGMPPVATTSTGQ